jgi:hypothetical protein
MIKEENEEDELIKRRIKGKEKLKIHKNTRI